jgi:hypothetical protein
MKTHLIKILLISAVSFVSIADAKINKNKITKVKSKPRVSRTIASAPNLSTNEQTVVDYLNCYNDEGQVLKLKKCVLRKMQQEISRSQKDRLYSWPLVFGTRLIEFVSCSEKNKKEIPLFGLSTPNFVCANVEVNDAVKEVVFFMKKDKKDALKLYSIYY